MRTSAATLFTLLALSSTALARGYDIPVAGSPYPGRAGAEAMAYSPDGKWAAVASLEGTLTTYAVDAVGALHLIGVWSNGYPCSGEVHLAFSPDSLNMFTTCADDNFVRLHTMESDGTSNEVGDVVVDRGPVGIATTPDGYVFVPTRGGLAAIYILFYAGGRLTSFGSSFLNVVPFAIAASRDGAVIAVTSSTAVETFQQNGGNLSFLSSSPNTTNASGPVTFSADRNLLVVADPGHDAFFYWYLDPNGALPESSTYIVTERQPVDLAFDRGGDVLTVVGAADSLVTEYTYDGTHFTPLRGLAIPGAIAVAFSYDTSTPTMAIATTGGTVSVFGNGTHADTTAPSVSCGAASGAWTTADVTITCTASDSESGLADPSQASFTLHTSVPAGSASANAATNSVQVCDQANNCTTAGPVAGNKVDKRPPTVTIATPPNGARYGVLTQLLSPVKVSYTCSDADSGIATCTGSVANGSTVSVGLFDLGRHSISVTATDVAGNSTTATSTYSVGLL